MPVEQRVEHFQHFNQLPILRSKTALPFLNGARGKRTNHFKTASSSYFSPPQEIETRRKTWKQKKKKEKRQLIIDRFTDVVRPDGPHDADHVHSYGGRRRRRAEGRRALDAPRAGQPRRLSTKPWRRASVQMRPGGQSPVTRPTRCRLLGG